MISLGEVAKSSIGKAINKFGEDAEFVIFPFGESGKILKGTLNYEYGIYEQAIIDNGLAHINSEIKDISYLIEHKNVVVLFALSRLDIYNDVKNQLYKYISPDRCVDVYKDFFVNEEYLTESVKLSKIYSVDKDFVRIGRDNDGGYVMVDDLTGGIAYSFGISNDPSWDLDMYRRGYEVYMYDHTVECPKQIEPYKDKMHFFKIGIAGKYEDDNLKHLEKLIRQNVHENENNMILKMDVEGAEWGFLETTSSETLNKFKQIVFEFHGMITANKEAINRRLYALNKLCETHRVVHLHANNCGGSISLSARTFPETWEITYMRKDCVGNIRSDVNLPINLDMPCNKNKAEIVLGDWNENFWGGYKLFRYIRINFKEALCERMAG